MWAIPIWIAIATTSCVIAPDPEPRRAAYEDVRRVVALLDDIAAEYPHAVTEGRVTSASRMRVIDTMLHDAQLYASRFDPGERATLAEIAAAVEQRAASPAVVERARGLRGALLAGYGLVLAPAATLDRARAEQQWHMLCAGCHGVAGMGDGPQGLGLDPEPKDFHEWAFMAELAPSRAFSQIADGVRETAMPQWGLFSTRERWGLAALVFGFRYDSVAIERGRAVVSRSATPASMSAVADRTDRQLLEQLRARGLDEASAADALAYLRGAVPFEPPTGPLAGVRLHLGELAKRYPERGAEPSRLLDAARARVLAAIEAIRAGAPHVASRLEHRLAELDHALATKELDEVVERRIARLGPVLDEAEQALRTPSAAGTLRLACEWALAAALGLGIAITTARRRVATTPPPGPVAIAIAAAGIGAAVGTNGPAFVVLNLGLVAAAVVAFTITRGPGRSWPELALAALAGAPVGSLARVLLEQHGPRAVTSLLYAVTVLVLACICARAGASRWPRITTVAISLALAMAAAGVAARAAAQLAPTGYLSIGRIEALGVLPSAAALAAAAAAAVITGVAALLRYGRRSARAG